MAHFLIIAAICGVIALLGRQNFVRALQIAAFVGVSCSHYLVLEIPGNLPNVTIHRAIVITLFGLWGCCHKQKYGMRERIPLNAWFKWLAISYGVSLLFGINWQDGFKDWISFLVESWGFYYLAYRGVRNRADAQAVLRAASFGLILVAIFAFTERYAGFNPVDRFLPGYSRSAATYADILSTYPHRILLGTAVAMGVPLIAAQAYLFPNASTLINILARITGMALCASACYFANSRGPWLAATLAIVGLWILGTAKLRRLTNWVAALAVLGMLLYPGVLATLLGRFSSITDNTTFKGGTYEYRWELWRVAYAHITQSPLSMVFGLGPNASRVIDQTWQVSYGDMRNPAQIWSWDNEYAYLLLCQGFVGLGLTLVLYCTAIHSLLKLWSRCDLHSRDGLAAIISALAVLLFMKSNVLIFAPQLNFLMWVLIACGLRWLNLPEHSEVLV